MTTKDMPDRPPILLFLPMFAGLLTLATGLATLSHPEDAPVEASATAGDAGRTPTSKTQP